jgi:hypothetical protein
MPHHQRKAIVIISGAVNYFYDVIGYRFAQALRNLGVDAHVYPLRDCPEQEAEWLFIVNVYETAVGYGNGDAALNLMRRFRQRSQHTYNVLLECSKTQWFAENTQLTSYIHADALLDLGFHDQSGDLSADVRRRYRPMFNGLTAQEAQQACHFAALRSERPVPWAFIGHNTAERVRVLDALLTGFDKHGLVYLPTLQPITATGPHITADQLQRILERTQWYLWNTHHPYFYMESERFRNAIMAGAVPIKIADGRNQAPATVPFSYLMLDEQHMIAQLQALTFEPIRQRFVADYLSAPSLEAELAAVLGVPYHAPQQASVL